MRFQKAEQVLRNEIEQGNLPGACLEIGNAKGTIERVVLGNRALVPQVLPLEEDTLFDMASCTKMMATSMVLFHMIEEGKICLNDRLGRFYEGLRPEVAEITIWNLLTHTSGIRPLTSCVGSAREDVDKDILNMPLAFKRGTAVGYACLAYIVLGRLLERLNGKRLDEMADEWFYQPMGMKSTCFCPKSDNIAYTDINKKTGEVSIGVVNDYNARALGGIVGNAGLFSNLHDCSTFARMLLNEGEHEGKRILSPAMIRMARTNQTPGLPAYENSHFSTARGLGMYMACAPLNPPAELLSPNAFGHTGHTGTGVFVDPDNGIYVVLLTSRLHLLDNSGEDIWRVRRLVHNAIAAEL